jgi:hypothetical protein
MSATHGFVPTYFSLSCDKSRSTSVSSSFPSQENLGGSSLLRQGARAQKIMRLDLAPPSNREILLSFQYSPP